MLKVAVSVGATMVTGTFTIVPFAGTVMVALLTETDRLTGGGEKPFFPPPQPVRARTRTALLYLAIL
jgi:hypothetical protein